MSMLALALGSILLLAGCSEWGPAPGRSGGTMTVSVPSLPATWDPDAETGAPSAQPIRDVEAPLLQLTPRTQLPAAGLARSWKYDESRTHLTVTIRPKAEFSNGDHVTAKDVVFSVDQWLKGPERGSFYSGLISGVSTHGKGRVVFALKKPSSAMLYALTLTSSAIVPHDFGGRTAADFYARPVGAGPFAISSTSSGKVDLKRNTHFYEASHPYLRHLDYEVVSDPATALRETTGGKIDLTEGVPASDLGGRHGHARVVSTPSQSTRMLTFSPKATPTDNLQLRKAVSLAIDRSALVKSVYDGKATVARGVLPANGHITQGCQSCAWSEHDAGLARSDLASVPGHQHLTLLVDSTDPADVLIAQAVTPMLAHAGITLSTQPVDPNTLRQRLASGSYEMALQTLTAQMPSPTDPLRTLVAGHYLAGATAVPAAETALQALDGATDQSDASAALAAFEKQAFDQVAAVPLVAPDVVDVVAGPVRGLDVLPSGLFHSSGLWLKK